MNKAASRLAPKRKKFPMPDNRSATPMPSAVREFAELLADIAIQQLRLKENTSQGEKSHD